MSEERKTLDMGPATEKESDRDSHTPSTIQADTLFTFISDFEYLIPYIQNACLYPRYCEENIDYLDINELKQVYIPMKCFCDINLHRINCHLDWYGYYGLAFPKIWGMNNGIQPVQYINPKSELCKDFSIAFNQALTQSNMEHSGLCNQMKNYMLHELMYLKPYEGQMRNRKTQQYEQKCFTDECEWRYVPNMSRSDFQQIYYDPIIMNAGIMKSLSDSLVSVPDIALRFNYSDLKYIIIKTNEDFIELVSVIDSLSIDKSIRNDLISKIIIWDKSRGDF